MGNESVVAKGDRWEESVTLREYHGVLGGDETPLYPNCIFTSKFIELSIPKKVNFKWMVFF